MQTTHRTWVRSVEKDQIVPQLIDSLNTTLISVHVWSPSVLELDTARALLLHFHIQTDLQLHEAILQIQEEAGYSYALELDKIFF